MQALTRTSNRHKQQHQHQNSAWLQNLFNFNNSQKKSTQRHHTINALTATNTKANRSKFSARRCLALCDLAIQLASAEQRRRNAIIHSLHLSPQAVANINRFNPDNAFLNTTSSVNSQPRIVSPTISDTARRRKQVTFAPVVEIRFFRKKCSTADRY